MSSRDVTDASLEIQQHVQRILLYIRLKTVEKLPIAEGKLEIHLSHAKNNLTKLEDHYPTNNIIDLSIFDVYKPTFSLMIEQDNIDDMNILCDNPLLLTLYDRVRRPVPRDKGDEEAEEREERTEIYEEILLPLSQGHIDLLKFYSKKREISTFSCFMYPLPIAKMSIGSCVTTWELYALMPLLKELTIHNIVYISFESIFNGRPNIADIADSLVADLYFESKVANIHNKYEKVKICTYDKFNKEEVPQSYFQLKWESLKSSELDNYDCLGIHCGNSVNIYNMFRHLVYAENSQINTENVNLNDKIITSNSTHRYVLSEQFVRLLEDVLAFDEQQILIELYQADEPNEILAQGHIDISILLYPEGKF